MSKQKDWRQVIIDIGVGTVADKIGMHYESVRAWAHDEGNPSRVGMLRLIKYIRGITVDDFLQDKDSDKLNRPYRGRKGATK